MNVSLFASSAATEPDASGPITKIYAAIKSGRWTPQVEQVRMLANSERQYQDAKRRLPAISISVQQATRRQDATPTERKLVASGRLQVDLDDRYDTDEQYDAVKAVLLSFPWIEAVFRSVRPTSLKAIARVPASVNELDHLAAFLAVERLLAEEWLTLDKACKDLGRLCFVSSDPDIVWRDATEVPITAADRENAVRHTDVAEPVRPWNDVNAAKLLAQLTEFSGTCRHNEAGAWAGNAVLLGASDGWIREQLALWFAQHGRDAGKGEIQRAIAWARTRADRGVLRLMGPGARKLRDPLWAFDDDEEVLLERARTAPAELADDAEWDAFFAIGAARAAAAPVTVAKRQLAVQDAVEFDLAAIPVPTNGLNVVVERIATTLGDDPAVFADPKRLPSYHDSEKAAYRNAIAWLYLQAHAGREYTYRDGFDWVRGAGKTGYEAIGREDFDRYLLASMGESVGTVARCNQALAHLRAIAQHRIAPYQRTLKPWECAWSNGVLDLERWLQNPIIPLVPIEAQTFVSYEPVVKWDMTAECPTWMAFLESINISRAGENLLQEWFGWNLIRDTKHHKFLVMCGPARAGKGTIIHVLTALLGESGVEPALLSRVNDSPYATNSWVGKRAVVFSDENNVDGRTLTNAFTHLLQVTSFDRVVTEKKFKDSTPVRLTARVTMACNTVPDFPDNAGALSARMLILPFRRSWVGNEDTGLLAKLLKELPGIAAWAAEGLRRLEQNGAFSEHADAIMMRGELKVRQSPLAEFAEEYLQSDPVGHVTTQDLFDVYSRWAPRANRNKKPGPHLTQGIRHVFPSVHIDRHESGKPRPIHGISWTASGLGLLRQIRDADSATFPGDKPKQVG
jgi:P4 family phage/plasmid primase-like protien